MSRQPAKASVGGPDRSRGRHAERRETAEQALLAAAIRLIAKHGVRGATLADLGKAAGYSQGLPGHYFKSKEKLLEAVLDYIEEHFSEQLSTGRPARRGLDCVRKVVEVSLMPANMEIAKAFLLLQKESLTVHSKLRPIIQKHNRRTIEHLATEIQIGIDGGEIRPNVDPQAEAVVVLAAIRGVNSLWATNPDAVAQDIVRTEMMASLALLSSKPARR